MKTSEEYFERQT